MKSILMRRKKLVLQSALNWPSGRKSHRMAGHRPLSYRGGGYRDQSNGTFGFLFHGMGFAKSLDARVFVQGGMPHDRFPFY
ncbi:MAG: hypothetical protein SGI77_13245 [Pirellulaceae bacterium]|nr:hypothetical protein [Pirellulaceae bacterium]